MEKHRSYHIWTIGCQMNLADSQRVAAGLERLGYTATARAEDADIVVLNTCVVRQQPEDKAVGRLQQLRSVKAEHPERVLALMGCMVGAREVAALEQRFPWVDLFLPPSDPTELWAYLAQRELLDEAQTLIADAESRRLALGRTDTVLPTSEEGRAVSAYVPIVLGCSHACTYCVIPYRRGPERSRPLEAIVAEATQLASQGVREITLLGQIVDRYGYDLPEFAGTTETPLVTLLRRVHEIAGLERLRFLTSHPNWMRDDLLDAVATLPKVCEHIEVPVQAGDDEVLKHMRRGYTVEDYRRLVARLRERIPGVSIATDIIVGFPGETEAQFENTVALLETLQLDKAHIARYSPRPLTVATRRFEDDVPYEEKERRRRALEQVQARILKTLNARLEGQQVEVLVEGEKKGRWFGRTRTDRLVFFAAEGNWLGRLAQVAITWSGPWSLIGEPVATE
ncbi:MAG TPA: tRNA (N6-isopentenyl adenosine(37)-C2)-methylthiotransferase MiaB [Anaerolineae bacterium]|nr:tRNA (N6-isopentenyl adenosine(37)-C2)-methylthiotransferase MiaB [Anaerolineae bacterium]HQJ12136.1 tRNA (N6-isopentenyl adenosine(37)-C2)-methylthiotransferase MiaB [Anaerolineae bacterium]HUM36612.1 tRNA (N6-isopentenyl adenosine(37)-C2)-methylthiotransferase MiaB [Anaerolineae bacterium]